ncbi:MAG: XRE family transcriptional regulator [Rhodospirillaceae bacterium]|nr:XRE family transcriptional regulator [Rhodospirillaceae bacterium]
MDEFIATLPRSERARIKARAAELVAEELSLRDIRRAIGQTQARLSNTLKIGQHAVSRLETRTDMRVSSLRSYVRALGGELELIARFPNLPAIRIEQAPAKSRRQQRSRKQAA